MRLFAFLFVIATTAPGQDSRARFEAASLKSSPPWSVEQASVQMQDTPRRIAYANVTLGLLVARAYGVSSTHVQAAEKWMESSTYDLAATFGAGATRSDIQTMLQTLLSERMGLVIHRVRRETSGLELYPDPKGVKLKQSTQEANGSASMLAGQITGPRVSMAALAGMLAIRIGRPVVDRTGLEGMFDIDLQWSPDAAGPDTGADENNGSIYTALREQLGLRLRPAKTITETLVIDLARREPKEP